MRRYVGRRVATFASLLVVVPLAVFLLVEFAPGDTATKLAGDNATPEVIAHIRAELGLDRQVLSRFADWAADAVRGDLGRSLRTSEEVSTMVSDRLGPTVSLVGVGLAFAAVIGSIAGIAAALRPKGAVDRIVSVIASVLVAAPPFWVALILVVVFAVSRQWLPATGYEPIGDGPVTWLRHLLLPGLSLALVPAAELARQLRGSLVEALSRDYILTARAKGLSMRQIVAKHALKNAAIPVVTVFAYRASQLVGGTVVVERVFNIRGIGDMAVDAVLNGDIPVVLAVAVVTTIAVVVINLLTDLSYSYFNPRIRTVG